MRMTTPKKYSLISTQQIINKKIPENRLYKHTVR